MFDFESLRFWKKVGKNESGVVKEWAVKEAWEFRNMM
ncbi:hypothetical protein PAP_07575 [Palaeococcus pacificus DY20341]|uniref:Uncharacterized protein n=1 Tax=Palaeococcus pacificus DY20341 TaxID=1343739 RepID=A0A075LU53_9EURY|nr:hypothetical protein PAP_07575 [Palaeococcus pacificus DY20341]